MPPKIIIFCRSTRWTTVDDKSKKKSEADNNPNCPEDASNWDDGATHPRRVFCGRVFSFFPSVLQYIKNTEPNRN
jgi:hypothetical protein